MPLVSVIILSEGIMLLFKTQTVRDKHRVNWYEELIMGAIANLGEPTTNDILKEANSLAMSPNTAHKYLSKLIQEGYVTQRRGKNDMRFAHVSLAPRGQEYLDAIKEAAYE